MSRPQKRANRPYLVEIVFLSGREPFATETYEIEAGSWYAAEREALERSGESVYDNGRNRDLNRKAAVTPP